MLMIRQDAISVTLKLYNRTEESLREDVDTIKKWMKTQPHLPEVLGDNKIENFLLLNKFCMERCKEKIDKYYTIRTLIPEIYMNSNPRRPHMKKIADVGYCIPMPKTTENHHRIIVYKLADTDTEKFDAAAFFAHAFNVVEIRIEEDKVLGDIIIYDGAGFSTGHLSKMSPTLMANINTITEKVYSARIVEIHYINFSPFVDTIITVTKSIVQPKMAKKMRVHKNHEGLYDYISKEFLPKDYGGEQESLYDLNEVVKQKLQEYQDRFDILDRLKVNESLRPMPLKNDNILGFHGNFRKLNVD